MVWISLGRPRRDQQDKIIQRAALLGPNHKFVGNSRNGPPLPKEMNSLFWRQVQRSITIGKGKKDFNKARDLLKKWAHFQLNWAFVDPETPLTQHHPYGNLSRVFLSWILNPLRVEYVDDANTDSGGKRFAYGTTTLRGHALAGEERFQVEWDKSSDDVTYEIYSFSRPGDFLSFVGYPIALYLQSSFAQKSLESMKQSIAED